jgi:hypothetical protein
VSGKAGASLAFSFLFVAYAHSHPEIFINQDSRQNETKQINISDILEVQPLSQPSPSPMSKHTYHHRQTERSKQRHSYPS